MFIYRLNKYGQRVAVRKNEIASMSVMDVPMSNGVRWAVVFNLRNKDVVSFYYETENMAVNFLYHVEDKEGGKLREQV